MNDAWYHINNVRYYYKATSVQGNSDYFTLGADASDCYISYGMNRLGFTLSGAFALSRGALSTNKYDTFEIGTFKAPTDIGLAHIGRQYGIAIKQETRLAYIVDLTGDNPSKIYMWAYGLTNIYKGDSFTFTITGLFI